MNYSDVFDHLRDTATNPTLLEVAGIAKGVSDDLDDIREELISAIEACRAVADDPYLDRLKEDASKARGRSADRFAQALQPPGPFVTHDQAAIGGGPQTPPHIAVRANVAAIGSIFDCARDLAKIAKRTANHLSKRAKAKAMLKNDRPGTRVFIGHGRAPAWLELKNYLQDRQHLQCDDFNREATAGKTTLNRLSQMLDDAGFALLVLTAEDEQIDGKVNARMNVIHEVGLFQGRLGFEKAIVLLENGCEQFSNIHGLTHISFDKGKISGAFHEVTDTLKREGLIV